MMKMRSFVFVLLFLAVSFPAAAQNDHTLTITPEPMTVILTPGGIDMDDIEDLNTKTTSTIVVTSPPRESGPICGGANQERCGNKPAEYVFKAIGRCPQGSFFDIGKWQCWSCPAGYARTLEAVDSDRACSKYNPDIHVEFGPATFRGAVCPSGSFYDGIRGGECRKCPSGYQRSAAHVDADNACYVPARHDHKRIRTHGKATGFFGTDCPGGQFWDPWKGKCHSCPSGYRRTAAHIDSANACSMYIPEKREKAQHLKKAVCNTGEFRDRHYQRGGQGGTCWTCPTAQTRTVFPVQYHKACEKTGGDEFKSATKKSDLTCPAGQIFDFIGISAHDFRTRPELQGKEVKTVDSGTCWKCPPGYDRTMSSVKSADACYAKSIAWYSQPFEEPGLFGLEGAEEVLLDLAKRNPEMIWDAINEVAMSVSEADDDLSLDEVRGMEIDAFTTSPHQSTAAAAVLLARVLVAAAEPAKASAAEKKLVESFKAHIIAKRTHIAEDALAAYDAWKEADTYWRSQNSRSNGLSTLFDYGTVPPDFSTIAMLNTMAIGAANTAISVATGSIPLLGDVLGVVLSAAGKGFADFSDPESALAFGGQTAKEILITKAVEMAVQKFAKATAASITKQLSKELATYATANAIKMIAKQSTQRLLSAAGSAGPQIIIAVSLMVIQVSIDQVTAIVDARPKLLNAVAHAKYDPGLERLVETEAGISELMGYWSYLIAGEKQPSYEFTKEFAKYANAAATGEGEVRA